MRGALIGVLSPRSRPTESRDFDRLQATLRRHRGRAKDARLGALSLLMMIDDADGPHLEHRGEVTHVAHGNPFSRGSTSRHLHLAWDGQHLAVTRDGFGLVPLFFRFGHGVLWFATEIHPLLALGSPPPDFEALSAYVAAVGVTAQQTGWAQVHRLPAGSRLRAVPGESPTFQRWWLPSDSVGMSKMQRGATAESLRSTIIAAVASSAGDRPGVLLSGGVDSSSIAVIAGLLALQPVLAHVRYPDAPTTDEVGFAHLAARSAGAVLHVVDAVNEPWRPIDETRSFQLLLHRSPHGSYDAGLAYLMGAGVRIALDGYDADNLFGDRRALASMLLLHGKVGALADRRRRFGTASTLRELGSQLLPPCVRPRALRLEPVGTDATPFLQGRLRERSLRRPAWHWPPRSWKIAETQSVDPLATGLYEEIESLAAGYDIDIRHPFADPQVVDCLLRARWECKIDPIKTKALLRDAMAIHLPQGILDRNHNLGYAEALRNRVDMGHCAELLRLSSVRLPGVALEPFLDAVSSDPNAVSPLLMVRMIRAHLLPEVA